MAVGACGSDGGGPPDGGGGIDLSTAADLADDPNHVPSLTPSSATVRRNGTVKFTADVPVNFSVTESNGGTIASDGTYTAPSLPGTFSIVAARADNPSIHVDAQVKVELGELVVVAGALGGAGSADGVGLQARFSEFGDQLASDSNGTLYIVDRGNGTVRRIAAGTDEVVTLVGDANSARAVTDGSGSQARFADPTGIAVDPAGTTLFVSECSANVIRRIDLGTRAVTTFAGAANMAGSTVGTKGSEARFDCPAGLAYDEVAGYLYVADRNNATLRRVKTAAGADQGKAELFAGDVGMTGSGDTTPLRFNAPSSLYLDRANAQLYVIDQGNRFVRKIATATVPATTASTLPAASFVWEAPRAIGLFQGRAHVAQLTQLTRIEDNTSRTTVAGHVSESGFLDDTADAARFLGLAGVAIVSSDALVADRAPRFDVLATGNLIPGGGAIRKVTLPGGVVTTRAGIPRRAGYADAASGALARFDAPTSVIVDSDGAIYVGDEQNWRLRKIVLGTGGSATVSTVAGDGTCCSTSLSATAGLSAKLAQVRCMAISGRTMIACSAGSTSLAKIDLSTADYQTQSIIVSGASPRGVAVKGGRTVYIATGSEKRAAPRPNGDHSILTIDLQAPGTPTRVYGNATGQPDPAAGGSIDGTGTAAYFSSPSGLALDDSESTLYVADSGHHAIRRIDLTSGAVTTIGGVAGQPGFADGTAGSSRFNDPAQLVFRDGALFIADRGNHVIRRLDVASNVTTTVLGTPGVAGVRTTAGAFALNTPQSISFLSTGEMLVVFGRSESAVVLAR